MADDFIDDTRFLTLVPRDKEYLKAQVEAINLRVVREDGVEVEPDIKFNTVTITGDLDSNVKIFRNQSGDQDKFSITALLHKDDTFQGKVLSHTERDGKMTDEMITYNPDKFRGDGKYKYGNLSTITVLDYYIRKGTPFYIHTEAVGIDTDKLWLVTENKKRTQKYRDGYVFWELTFTRYRSFKFGTFEKNSKGVDAAIKKHKQAAVSAKTKLKQKIRKCWWKTKLVYSKTKKTSDCVKTMQEILYKENCFSKNMKKSECIDGWYGKDTLNAVKVYQKKKASDYGCQTNGHVDYQTWRALCGYAKLDKQITVKTGLSASQQAKKATSNSGIVNVNVNTKNSTTSVVGDLGKLKQPNASVTIKATNMTSQNIKETTKTTTVKLKGGGTSTTKTTTNKGGKKTGKKTTSSGNKKSTTTNKKNGTTVTKSKGKSTKVTTKSDKNKKSSNAGKKK